MGVEVYEDSVNFIRHLRKEGLKTAVVSASKNTVPVLQAAGVADLFDVCVDGVEAARLGLKGKPSPDTFLHAAKLDEGAMWPVAFALLELTAADEAHISALVKQAAG